MTQGGTHAAAIQNPGSPLWFASFRPFDLHAWRSACCSQVSHSLSPVPTCIFHKTFISRHNICIFGTTSLEVSTISHCAPFSPVGPHSQRAQDFCARIHSPSSPTHGGCSVKHCCLLLAATTLRVITTVPYVFSVLLCSPHYDWF